MWASILLPIYGTLGATSTVRRGGERRPRAPLGRSSAVALAETRKKETKRQGSSVDAPRALRGPASRRSEDARRRGGAAVTSRAFLQPAGTFFPADGRLFVQLFEASPDFEIRTQIGFNEM
jgi:hypothetical protein